MFNDIIILTLCFLKIKTGGNEMPTLIHINLLVCAGKTRNDHVTQTSYRASHWHVPVCQYWYVNILIFIVLHAAQ